jgi:RNA polymerase sigma-70 factor (ECF subfamily)
MKRAYTGSPSITPPIFQALYQEHAGRLRDYLTRSLRGDTAEAEGIVQDAFLKAWEKRAELKNIKAFRSWLYSIALNVLRQRHRKLKPLAVEDIEVECERPNPERHTSDRQELALVAKAFKNLPFEQREAIRLVRLECMKFSEAAGVLNVPDSTVKTWVRRGLLAIAEEVGL